MSQMMEVLSRPEVMLACAGALVMLMMLAAIMLRMSRRDREHESRLSELRQALDEQLTGVRAQTEAQLRMTDDSLRRSVEQLSDGVARALSDSERGQSGRMDELGARMEQEHADSVRRMAALRDDVARDTAREVNARLDAALGDLSAQLGRLSGEMVRLSDAAGELEALRAALEARPQPVMQGAQLDALLMQWLSPGRYVRRFEVGTGSGRYADFAILMPEESGQLLYLPVDASFPAEEYAGAWHAEDRRRLGDAVTAYARRMAEELIKPGLTADFALMLIPSELVSARVSELEDVMQSVQQTRRVIPVGPSAFWAMVRAMEGGMNALAMQRRSAEVERLLDEVRQELGRFTRALASPDAQERGAAEGAYVDGGASRGESAPYSAAREQAATADAHVDGGAPRGESASYSAAREQAVTADAHVDGGVPHDKGAPYSVAQEHAPADGAHVNGEASRGESAPYSTAQEHAPADGAHVNGESSRGKGVTYPVAPEQTAMDDAHVGSGASRGESAPYSAAREHAATADAHVNGGAPRGESTPHSAAQEQAATEGAHVDGEASRGENAPYSAARESDSAEGAHADGGAPRGKSSPYSPAQEHAPTDSADVNDEASRDGGKPSPAERVQAATGGKAVPAGSGQAGVSVANPRGEEASAASWRGQTRPAGRTADEVARAARGDGELDIWS